MEDRLKTTYQAKNQISGSYLGRQAPFPEDGLLSRKIGSLPGRQAPLEDVISEALEENLVIVGYSTFSGWPTLLKAREDPHVRAVARKHDRTSEQVLLRHAMQKGLVLTSFIGQGGADL